MKRRHALTSQVVISCTCSVTNTIFDPNSRVLISSGVSTTFSFGSIKLLLVREMMLMVTKTVVSVI